MSLPPADEGADMTLPPVDQGVQDAEWRRLSARMLLVMPVRDLGQYIPALIGLLVAGRAMGNGQLWWLGPLGVVGIIALSVVRWMTTRYRITPDQVQLRTGLLQRKTIATPADRIRSVDVTASALHRLLGLAKVEIGTGSHDKASGLSLDSLTLAQAAGLRAELLHRSAVLHRAPPAAATPGAAGLGAARLGAAPAPGATSPQDRSTDDRDTDDRDTGDRDTDDWDAQGPETELARMDPRWVRFAPFTTSGVLTAAAILGVGSRLLDQLGMNLGEVGPVRGGLAYAVRNPIWLDALLAFVALGVFVTVLSIGGYVLSYWGFRLTRHSGGSLQITRGLLTTRSTSVEERRLRGIELAEPLMLRAVHAARLSGITTGLTAKRGADGGSSLLLPPAPRAVAGQVAAQILGDPEPMQAALTAHGRAARRRRLNRALVAALVLVGAASFGIWAGASPWLALPALATIPAAVLLALDRYRSLGHVLVGRFLVTRAGTFSRRRDVLECDGIIGWNLGQTFFQRRVALVTLTATTAAGRQGYDVTDLPMSAAVSLGDQAVPGLLDQFLAPAPGGQAQNDL